MADFNFGLFSVIMAVLFYLKIPVFFFFTVPQAFKYLREEVKVFQGRPIMVSSSTRMQFTPTYRLNHACFALRLILFAAMSFQSRLVCLAKL